MFLHCGASLHGHEYSPKRSPSSSSQPATRDGILKSALRPLSTPPEFSIDNCFVTSSRSEPLSRRRALTGETHRRPSIVLRQRAASNSFTKKELSVRFREPDMEHVRSPSASEDEESIAGSDLTDGAADTSTRRSKRRRLPRKSTRYAIAQPAPQLRTKQRHLVQIRPRLLLQLQEIGDKRAIPAFDLVPSHLVVGSLILPTLVKRFPRLFHAHAELGQDDILLVRSDDYGSAPVTTLSTLLSNPGRGPHHDKDVCAVISALPKGCRNLAELVMEDGSSWAASAMANGSYEFTGAGQDGETVTARWVRRSTSDTRHSLASVEPCHGRNSLQGSAQDQRWTFSIIDPSSRRHPIMGSLTPEALEIYEDYTTVSTSSGRFPPSRFFGSDGNGHHGVPAGLAAESRRTLQVLHEQKALMIATASWIRLHQQGWPGSSNPKLANVMPCRSCSVASNPRAEVRRRAFSSCDDEFSNATSRPASPDSIHGSSLSQQRQAGLPARAMSTGRAFMEQRSSRLQALATVHSQEPPQPTYQPEKLTVREAEKMNLNCLGKVRQWANKVLHRKKEIARQAKQ
ncbi:hypothetical protein E4U61_002546 [Claviceps capensis]|nr:hypothetical protein E4U61_002546 [Claviceps capensis]